MTTFPLRQYHVTIHSWSHDSRDHFWPSRDSWLIINFHKTRNVPGLLRVSQNQRNICLLDHFWYFRPKLYINILKLYYFIKWYLKRLLLYQSGILRVLNRLKNNGIHPDWSFSRKKRTFRLSGRSGLSGADSRRSVTSDVTSRYDKK